MVSISEVFVNLKKAFVKKDKDANYQDVIFLKEEVLEKGLKY